MQKGEFRRKIQGYEYTIELKPRNEMGSCGFASVNTGKITIANDICQQQQESVLLHEIIEVIDMHAQSMIDHSAITNLERGLYQTLADLGVDWKLVYDNALDLPTLMSLKGSCPNIIGDEMSEDFIRRIRGSW